MRRIQRILILIFFPIASFAADKDLKLGLTELIQRTLAHHPVIQEAKQRCEESEARYAMAKSNLFPQLSLEANVGTFHDRVANPGEDVIPPVGRDRNRYVGKLILVQPIFHGFGLWNGIEMYKKKNAVVEAALEKAKAQALKEMLRAYFEVQVKRDEVQAREEAKAFHENQWKQTKMRFSQGRATRLQLLEAEYVAGTEQPVIETLQGEIENRILQMASSLDLQNPQLYQFSDSLEAAMGLLQESALPPAEEAVKALAAHSPQLHEARLQVEATEAEAALELSEDLPSIDLYFSAGTDSYLRQDIATADTLFYSGEVRLKIPLFSGLSSLHKRRANRSLVNARKKVQAKTEQDSLTTLLGAYHSWKVATTRIAVARKEVAFMEEKLSLTQKNLRAGRSTLSDVLEAYSELLDAKKKRGDAVIEKIMAVTDIRSLLGWFSHNQGKEVESD
ncbi:MAG: TolC family protein [Bdellovibrionota bacterium]